MKRRSASGILPVDKGPGVTSFQVVAHLRRVMRAPKIGHGGHARSGRDGGAADPYRRGDQAHALSDRARQGVRGDRAPRHRDRHAGPERCGARAACRARPRSGGHRGGPPAIRRGDPAGAADVLGASPRRQAALRARPRGADGRARGRGEITVHAITLESVALARPHRCACDAARGRTSERLAADLGTALGSGAALGVARPNPGRALCDRGRGRLGRGARRRPADALWERLLPLDSALPSLAPVRLDAAESRAFCHGQAVAAPSVAAGTVRVYGADGVLLGIGTASGAVVRPARLCSMRIIHGLPSFPPELSPSVVALGAFDGIHLAHARISGDGRRAGARAPA